MSDGAEEVYQALKELEREIQPDALVKAYSSFMAILHTDLTKEDIISGIAKYVKEYSDGDEEDVNGLIEHYNNLTLTRFGPY